MNILVTGGAGFIGSHVADALVHKGHRVIIVDNLSSGNKAYINPEAEFYQLDIREKRIEEIFKEKQIDVVNHQAAQMDVRRSVDDPKFDASINVIGSLNLLQLCVKYSVPKFLFGSTGGAIYGEQEYFPADELHPARPLSPYGVSKLATENYLFYYKEVHGLPYVALRYSNVYGPRQNPYGEAGVVSIFTNKMLNGEQPIINGDGTQTRDYVCVEDVVRANLLALEYKDSAIFNVGTGIETDVKTIFKKLKEITHSTSEEKHGPPKLGEQKRSVLNCSKIKKGLGWEPTVCLDDGLKRAVEFFSTQKN